MRMLASSPPDGRFIFPVMPVPEIVVIGREVTGSVFKGSSCLTILSRWMLR